MSSSEEEDCSYENTAQKKLEPKFAAVRFSDDPLKYYYHPVNDIKEKVLNENNKATLIDFIPASIHDFNPKMLYRVRWYCDIDCTQKHKHYEYHSARILYLGASEEDCKEKIDRKRVKFQKANSDVSGETQTTTLNDEDMEPDDTQSRAKANQVAAANIINKGAVLKNFLSKRKPLVSVSKQTEESYLKEGKRKCSEKNEEDFTEHIETKVVVKDRKKVVDKIKSKPVITGVEETNLKQLLLNKKKSSASSSRQSPIKPMENDGKQLPTLENNDIDDSPTLQAEKENFLAACALMKSPDMSCLNTSNGVTNCGTVNINTQNVNGKSSESATVEVEITNQTDRNSTNVTESVDMDNDFSENASVVNNANVYLDYVDHTRRPAKVQYQLPPKKVNLAPLGLSQFSNCNNNNQVYLGLDVFVDRDVWVELQKQKKPTIYLRDLSEIIWKEALPNKTFDVSSSGPGVDGADREEFEEDKWQLLVDLYMARLKTQFPHKPEVQAFWFEKLTETIRQKIQDVRQRIRKANKETGNGHQVLAKKQRKKRATTYIDIED